MDIYRQFDNKLEKKNSIHDSSNYQADGLVVVDSYGSEYVIALPCMATITEQTAAKELAEYIYKSTGTSLLIVKEDETDKPSIYIGHTEYAKNRSFNAKGEEEWINRVVDEHIVVTGGVEPSHRGVLYAVYHLLEDFVGIRWWNVWEEYVPQLKTLIIARNYFKTGEPRFKLRSISNALVYQDMEYTARSRMNIPRNVDAGAFNKTLMNYGGVEHYGPPGHAHTLNLYISPEWAYVVHPDWLAWSQYEKKHLSYGQFCLSNKEFCCELEYRVIKNIVDSHRDMEQKGVPKSRLFHLSLNDTAFGCECKKCKESVKKSGESGHLLKLINRIARRVAQENLAVEIETLVYSYYMNPPLDDTLPEKNVAIRLADISVDMLHDIYHKNNADKLRNLQLWSDICRRSGSSLYIWDYMININMNCVVPNIHSFAINLKAYYHYDVTGYYIENQRVISSDFWALKQWLITQLMENPLLDIEALMDDFIFKYYGAAGIFIKEYLSLVNSVASKSNTFMPVCKNITNANFITLEIVLRGDKLFEQALSAVRGDDILLSRVRIARSCLDKTILNRFREFKWKANVRGTAFLFDRNTVALRASSAMEEQIQLKKIIHMDGGYDMITMQLRNDWMVEVEHAEIELLKDFAKFPYEKIVLPEKLRHIASDRILEICMYEVTHYVIEQYTGVERIADEKSRVGYVVKIIYNKLPDHAQTRMRVSFSTDENPRPFVVSITNPSSSLRLYREDFTSNEYQLYQLPRIQRIKGDSHSELQLILYEYDLNLSAIAEFFSVENYDIYISMKTTGTMYNGNDTEENAIYLESIFIVKAESEGIVQKAGLCEKDSCSAT